MTRAALVVVLLLGVVAAGCSSSSKRSSSSTTSANDKTFAVSTPAGQVSVSLDGQLPPNWPAAFPVAPETKPAGSGSLGNSNGTVMVGVYTSTGAPESVFGFYKASTAYTVESTSSAGAGTYFIGYVQFKGAYTGSTTVISHDGSTYVVVVLESSGSGTTTVTT